MKPRSDCAWYLSLERADRGDVAVFVVAGRLGVAASGTFVHDVMKAASEGKRLFVVDFKDVDYISSAGFAALESIASRLQPLGGALRICGLTEPVRLALSLAGPLQNVVVEDSISRPARLR